MTRLLWLVFFLFLSTGAWAQNTTCATRPAGDNSNACASTAFVHNWFPSSPLPVPNGGTGDTSFTANLPLIGNGTSPIAQGTRSGNTTAYITADGTLINGHCASIDSVGGIVDAGGACTVGGGGGTVSSGLANQYAFYQSNGTVVSGLQAPYLHSKVFGATGNGVTNDTTALQNWINACEASTQVCWLDPGFYVITSALSITTGIRIDGAGALESALTPSTTTSAISISTTSGVSIEHIGIDYPSAASNTTNAITVTAASGENSSSVFRDLRFLNAYNGFQFVKASAWTVDEVQDLDYGNAAFVIQNQNNPDSGDSTITGTFNLGASSSTLYCVQWASSGGLRFINNKCVTMTNGVAVQLAPGAGTNQLLITGNSFDQLTGIAVSLARQAATGSFGQVMVTGNTCNGVLICVKIPHDANGVWLNNLTVTGNGYIGTNSTSAEFVDIDSINGAAITGNILVSNNNSSKAFNCGAAATGVVYGPNPKTGGAWVANTNSCTATLISPN